MNTNLSQPQNLEGWLSYLEAIHPAQIDMGLERVAAVYKKLALPLNNSQIILVAGTNGKGTTCRFLELLAQSNGLTTGVYSSPHISDYRERVRVNDALLDESAHCTAFAKVERARADVSLTYFEFGTLAALVLLAEAQSDVIILEVGLGGRLDAVNIVEPDISVITTVDLDHQAWLGTTREQVGFEKAGIMRTDKPCVVGELNIPRTVIDYGATIAASMYLRDKDFSVQESSDSWQFSATLKDTSITLCELPKGALPIQNAATAFYTAGLLGWSLAEAEIRKLLSSAALPGRMERLKNKKHFIVDVAHNPQATQYLYQRIQSFSYDKLIFVLGMLSDKDSKASLEIFKGINAKWFIAPLDCTRSAAPEVLESAIAGDTEQTFICESIKDACSRALAQANEPQDLIIGFGSFYTVSEIKQALAIE